MPIQSAQEDLKPVPRVILEILARRGYAESDIHSFLYPDYEKHLHDPFLLHGMDHCVDRILKAAKNHESVAVYGDYDIDGITASAIMIEGLAALGIQALSYIPDRFEEGYGINQFALEELKKRKIDLVISVDCGITSVNEAKWALNNDLELIITDHHSVPEILPTAVAIINPKQPGDLYPFKGLCGAGVAFKVVQALALRSGLPAPGQEKWLLDLVALGTVCDIVELTGENRVLVAYGLRVMRQTRRVGLRALANVGGVNITAISAEHLGFILGPRMNAAGRLEHASRSLELLLTRDEARASQIAEQLDQLNQERRTLQNEAYKNADLMAAQYTEDPVLVLAHSEWSHGIVGIVASKIVEKWQKPTLIAQIEGTTTKGSARSIGTYNMVEALRANDGLLIKFGGHFHAAGYTINTEDIPRLREGMCKYFIDSKAQNIVTQVPIDLTLLQLTELNWEMYENLQLLEPHGAANPAPVIQLKNLHLIQVLTLGSEKNHLKLSFADKDNNRLTGIGFGIAAKYHHLKAGQKVTIIGTLSRNDFRGNSTLQIMIKEVNNE